MRVIIVQGKQKERDSKNRKANGRGGEDGYRKGKGKGKGKTETSLLSDQKRFRLSR